MKTKFNKAFWEWFGDSKVVDESGEPLVVYHGTGANFNKFDMQFSKKNFAWLGKGFYFGTNLGKIKTFGKKILKCYLKMNNPYYAESNDPHSFHSELKMKYGQNYEVFPEMDLSIILKDNDFDGVIYKHWDYDEYGTFYVVFNPNQIKSVNNDGTWDNDDDSILSGGDEDTIPEWLKNWEKYSAYDIFNDKTIKELEKMLEDFKNEKIIADNTTKQLRGISVKIIKQVLSEKYAKQREEKQNYESNIVLIDESQLNENRDFNGNFWEWFGDSKVLDKNGSPLAVYHFTYNNFDKFDANFIGSANHNTVLEGFYFSDTPFPINKGGKNIKVYLSIKNPIIINVRDSKWDTVGVQEIIRGFLKFDYYEDDLIEYLIEVENYDIKKAKQILKKWKDSDGVILYNVAYDIHKAEYIVFSPNQIKSVNNDGTWDNDDDSILSDSNIFSPNRNVTFDDYHRYTVANFKSLPKKNIPKRNPDFKSKSGSQYWYEGDTVYRYSTHFFRKVSTCKWFLDGVGHVNKSGFGYCKLSDFKPIINLEIGSNYKVYYAPKDRNGIESLTTFDGKYLKETDEYYVFDNKKISKTTYCTAQIINENLSGANMDIMNKLETLAGLSGKGKIISEELSTKAMTLFSQKSELSRANQSKLNNLFDIINLKFGKDLVKEQLKNRQKNKDFKDTSYDIEYTKKFKRNYQTISLQELAQLERDPVTAYQNVTKDKVWQPIDVKADKESGKSSGLVYGWSKLRKQCGKQPPNYTFAREMFVKFISELTAIYEKSTIWNQFAELKSKYLTEYRKYLKEHSAYKTLISLTTSRNIKKEWYFATTDELDVFILLFGKAFYNSLIGENRAELDNECWAKEKSIDQYTSSLTPNGYPDYESGERNLESKIKNVYEQKERYNKLLEILEGLKSYLTAKQVNDEMKRSGSPFSWSVGRNVTNVMIKRWYKEELESRYKEQDGRIDKMQRTTEDWEWASEFLNENDKDNATNDNSNNNSNNEDKIVIPIDKNNLPMYNRRPPLSHIVRTGGEIVNENAINTTFIKNEFGIEDTVFGNYMNDEMSKESIRHFVGALYDLQDMTGLDIKQINQISKLTMAFGAMGSGSSACATYYPSRKAINLTKSKGDGSVAHEWGHYLDNVLKEQDLRTGTYEYLSNDKDSITNDFVQSAKYLVSHEEFSEILESVMKSIINNEHYQYLITKGLTKKFTLYQLNDITRKRLAGKKSYGVDYRTFNYLQNRFSNTSLDNLLNHYDINMGNDSQDDKISSLYWHLFSSNPGWTQFNGKLPFTRLDYFKDKESISKFMLYGDIICRTLGKSEIEVELPTSMSQFYINSVYYDMNKSKPYWATNVELFARAFESMIDYKLELAGRKNTYLANVHNAIPDEEKSASAWLIMDDERAKVLPEFDAMLDKIKIELNKLSKEN